jgi:glycosyltransferase involved in cell wall biosynthesis
MKIGIDATFTPHGGSHGHLEGFVKNISKFYPRSDIILYLKKENTDILDKAILNKCTLKFIKITSFNNISRIFWGQFILPFVSLLDQLDVLFCPGNISPILKTTRVKAQWIATIGPFCKDMYKGVKFTSKFSLIINKYLMLLSSYSSNVVIHQSEYSKNLFIKKYYFQPIKQYLIECGKDDFYQPRFNDILELNPFYKISNEDYLYVSHLYPYKNILRLINAFSKYKRNEVNKSKLYIVGKIMDEDYYSLLQKTLSLQNIKKDIIFTGPATKFELRYIYSKCKIFIFPSLCESSGYTLIEAMSCGAPILASDRTAIPFTCKNAVEYFDAYDEDDLHFKLEKLSKNIQKLKDMKKDSIKRATEMINYESATNVFLDIVKSKI